MRFYLSLFFLCWINLHASFTKDFHSAQIFARSHQMPMALFFTGSDWSLESKQLIDVLSRGELYPEFVCVLIDYPENNFQSEENCLQNHHLLQKFKIDVFPTIILFDSEKKEMMRCCYPILGVEDFEGFLISRKQEYDRLNRKLKYGVDGKDSTLLMDIFTQARKIGAYHLASKAAHQGAVSNDELLLEEYILDKSANLRKQYRDKLRQSSDHRVLMRLALIDYQKDGQISDLKKAFDKHAPFHSQEWCEKMQRFLEGQL